MFGRLSREGFNEHIRVHSSGGGLRGTDPERKDLTMILRDLAK
jgi:hypothetical protein